MAQKSRLRQIREAAGMSLRELARQIDQQPTNVSYWERTGLLPRSDVLLPMAQALGVTVEELLGQPRPKRNGAPGGRLGQVFQEVGQLPRRQQDKIIEVVKALLAQHASQTEIFVYDYAAKDPKTALAAYTTERLPIAVVPGFTTLSV